MNNLREFDSRQALHDALSALICEQLEGGIKQRGTGRLIVSGGSTPIPLFHQLAKTTFDWQNVSVCLADERLVPADHPRCNASMVQQELLQEKAAAAAFLSLSEAAQTWDTKPFADITLLGMGNDGHTASLFPDAPELKSALNGDQPVYTMTPPSQPEARETFGLQTLCASQQLVLHIEGEEKYRVLQEAMNDSATTSLPIRTLIEAAHSHITIFWAP
ncbi:6-phosphogluconolactonase [Candidatus Litorirhabdus singularis]|nr:6-phosphogluconolactonase [Candidatus Litorirhabdus singularis]